jgi:hypothetical protein
MVPRDDLLDLVDPAERYRLRGTIDSEAYFAVMRGSAAATEPRPARSCSPTSKAGSCAAQRPSTE